jgi:hypothetical protein
MNMDILNPLFRGARDSETGDLGLSAATSADPLQASANRLWRRVARECEAMADHWAFCFLVYPPLQRADIRKLPNSFHPANTLILL